MRRSALLFWLCLVLMPVNAWADTPAWLKGYSIAPGIGVKHFGLDVVRLSDGFTGNIANKPLSDISFALNMETRYYRIPNSIFFFSVRAYAATVTLDHQFYNAGYYCPATGTYDCGFRVDVGTQVNGYYSYVVPMISMGNERFRMGFGIGMWKSNLAGDIELTANDQPVGGVADTINLGQRSQLAYLAVISFNTHSGWVYEMMVGGPSWSDGSYRYQIEEVSLVLARRITF